MSDLKQEIVFADSGLNFDLDSKFLSNGSSNYRLNCSFYQEGNIGIITNTKGNTIKATLTGTCIGAYADETNSYIYIFDSDDKIHRYSIIDGTSEYVLDHTALNFSVNYPILSCTIIDGWLYWTDANNPPRHINIERAVVYTNKTGYSSQSFLDVSGSHIGNLTLRIETNYSYQWPEGTIVYVYTANSRFHRYYKINACSSSGVIDLYCPIADDNETQAFDVYIKNADCYLKITEEELNIQRKPPTFRPACWSDYVSTYKGNFLYFHTFKFAYRYIYNDYSKSVFSPISLCLLPDFGNLTIDNTILNTAHNTIMVHLDSGGNEVIYVELAVSVDDGAWTQVDKIDTSEYYYRRRITYQFHNDKLYSAYTVGEVQKSFDTIPDKTKSIESLNTGNLVLAGNTFTKEKAESTIVVSAFERDISVSSIEIGTKSTDYSPTISLQFLYTYTFDEIIVEKYYIIDFTPSTNKYISNVLSTTHGLGVFTMTDSVINSINYSCIYGAGASYFEDDVKLGLLKFHDYGRYSKDSTYVFRFSFNKAVDSDLYTQLTLGIEEHGTPTAINRYSQSPTQCLKVEANMGIAICYYDKYRNNVGITSVSNLYTSGVTTGRYGSNYVLPRISGLNVNIYGSAPSWAESYQILLTANQKSQYYRQFLAYADRTNGILFLTPTNDNDGYDYVVGDRVIIYSKSHINPPSLIPDSWTIIETDILFYQLNDNGVTNITVKYNGFIVGDYYGIEIYRPSQSTLSYYEASPVYEIENLLHLGTEKNQTSSSDYATIKLYEGNIWARNYVGLYEWHHPIETKYPSPVEASNSWSYGKPNVDLDTLYTGQSNSLLLSNHYIKNTQINGLATFDWEESTKELNSRYGDIYASVLIGDVLLIFQENKVTSFYIGKTELYHASGGSTVAAVDSVLGTSNESTSDYGCQDSQSISKNNNNVFYYDRNRTCVVRYSQAGHDEISKLGLVKAIKDYLALNTTYKVISCYDNLTMTVYFTFIGDQTSKTFGFHTGTNKWVSEYSFIPNLYIAALNKFYSFKTTGMYEHEDSTANRCTFYGVKYNQSIKIVANQNPNVIKVFDAISMFSNKLWDAIIEIPTNYTYLRGMYSRLKKAMFVKKEGKLFANFLRNMKTNQVGATLSDLHNGEKLRGEYAEITLTNNEDVEVKLSQVNINSTVSLGTNI